jgi:hypothetical protein
LDKSECDGDDRKEVARGFLDKLCQEMEGSTDFTHRLLKFYTGYASVPPHGLTGKVAVNFLPDDDTKPIPKAVSCLHVLSIPV